MKRRALQSNWAGQRLGTAQPASVPPPVRGINARDPLGTMQATDAVQLENLWPVGGECRLRGGSRAWATIGADYLEVPVLSLLTYANRGGTQRMFTQYFATATSVDLKEISAPKTINSGVANTVGDVGFTPCRGVNFTNSVGGAFLWVTNPGYSPWLYDGVNYGYLAEDDAGGAYPNTYITGVDAKVLTNPWVFKRRIFAIENKSSNVWYLDSNSIAGAMTRMPLGPLFTRGGYLVAGATWTIDAGAGADDYFVVITSNGEVAVYQGTDPSSALTWALVGVYFVGIPLTDQCFFQFGGDLGVLTEQGIFPLSQALPRNTLSYSKALSDRINPYLQDLIRQNRGFRFWCAVVYAAKNALIINVPTSLTTSFQLVYNIDSGAWAKFTGWNATIFAVYKESLFFGDFTGDVYRAWDDADYSDAGSYITGKALTSFTHFGKPVGLKKLSMIRPTLFWDGTTEVKWGIAYDYETSPTFTSTQAEATPSTSSQWQLTDFDFTDFGGLSVEERAWRSTPGRVGHGIALYLQVKSKSGSVRWTGTDYVLDQGGLL